MKPRTSEQMLRFFLLFFFICLYCTSQAQNDLGFLRQLNITVSDSNGSPFKFGWAGGLNSCQFSEIDLNGDGIKDLFVFDRNGNRVLTFINNGTPNTVDYTYAPEYQDRFPAMTDWALLRDYNCDGKEDIFTYGVGGIKVFKNVTTLATGLKFQLVSNQILSYVSPNYTNIYLTSVDYPAIEDFDGDGDLDILVFWIIGTYIEYHRNMSMEHFGNCDSLDYRIEKHCWGFIKEGDTSNYISMNINCPWIGGKSESPGITTQVPESRPGERHVGSTLLATDLNGDGLKDLIIGDVDYPNVIRLINGGTIDSAHMVTEDNFFPSYNVPVNLYSMPDVNYIDINNDGKKELLASPMDPTPTLTENFHSVWLYNNNGTTASPIFSFSKDNFLQEDMIDVGTASLPTLVDVDGDGLPDLIVGNYGYYDSSNKPSNVLHSYYHASLAYLKNTGTAQNPQFMLMTRNFANIAGMHLLGACPTFGDLDGDGAQDMLLGNSDGKLYYFHNHAGAGNPMSFDPPVTNYQGIDAGDYSAPQLVDLDGDGKLDLVIGNKKGRLVYYHNTGTVTNPVFTHVTDSLGHVNVSYPDITGTYDAYAVPCFFKPHDGKFRLFIGSLRGGITYYKNIEDSVSGHFALVDPNYLFIQDGSRSAFAIGNLDGDTMPDMIMGTISGGLDYFKGSAPPPLGINEISDSPDFLLNIYPNPASGNCKVEVSGLNSNQYYRLEVFDILGVMEMQKFVTNVAVQELNLISLKPGIHLLKASLVNKNGQKSFYKTKKLVVSY